MLLTGDRERCNVVDSSCCPNGALQCSFPVRWSISVPSGCFAEPCRTSAPVSASRTTTLHDCVEESTPASSVTSAGTHQVFDRKLLQAYEAVALGARSIDIEVGDLVVGDDV